MRNKWFVMCGLTVFLCTCCGESRSGNGGYSEEYSEEMVVCPFCGGGGVVSYDMYTPPMECPGCQGKGGVTPLEAQQIIDVINQTNAMMNGGDYDAGGYAGGDYDPGTGYGGGYSSGRDAYQIQMELEKAYDLLETMKRNYENCTSGVLQAQYPSMISEQESRIYQLEQELRNAQ